MPGHRGGRREQDKVAVPEEEKKLILSVLLSRPNGISLKAFQRDYKNLNGSNIDYVSKGYHNITEYLQAIPETARIEYSDKDKEYKVFGVVSDPNMHLNPTARKAMYKGSKRKENGTPLTGQRLEWAERMVPNTKGQYALCFSKDGPGSPYSREEISKTFGKYGDLQDVAFTDRFIFVRFRELDMALDCMEALGDEYNLKIPEEKGNPKRTITFEDRSGLITTKKVPTQKKKIASDDNDEQVEIFVGNVPLECTDAEMNAEIKHLDFINLRIKENKREGKKFAFILCFERNADDIVDYLHRREFKDRKLIAQRSYKKDSERNRLEDKKLLEGFTKDGPPTSEELRFEQEAEQQKKKAEETKEKIREELEMPELEEPEEPMPELEEKRFTEPQKTILLDEVEKCYSKLVGKLSKSLMYQDKVAIYKEITEKVNSVGKKKWHWEKVKEKRESWFSKVKNKAAALRLAREKSGLGVDGPIEGLTPLEDRIMGMIGDTVVSGIKGGQSSTPGLDLELDEQTITVEKGNTSDATTSSETIPTTVPTRSESQVLTTEESSTQGNMIPSRKLSGVKRKADPNVGYQEEAMTLQQELLREQKRTNSLLEKLICVQQANNTILQTLQPQYQTLSVQQVPQQQVYYEDIGSFGMNTNILNAPVSDVKTYGFQDL